MPLIKTSSAVMAGSMSRRSRLGFSYARLRAGVVFV